MSGGITYKPKGWAYSEELGVTFEFWVTEPKSNIIDSIYPFIVN